MASAGGSALFQSVVGGKLKLKRSATAAAATHAPGTVAPSRGAAAQMAGTKRSAADMMGPRGLSVALAPQSTAPAESAAGAGAAPPGEAPAVVVALTDTRVKTIKASADGRTEAQRRHDEALAAQKTRRIGKLAEKSHREKIDGLNQYLAKIPEHYDLFRISYAGTG